MTEFGQDHTLAAEGQLAEVYRLRSPLRRTSRSGRAYLRVKLEDMNGKIGRASCRERV